MSRVGIEAAAHPAQDGRNILHMDRSSVLIEHLDEAAHVGALEMVREVDRHRDCCDGVLQFSSAVANDDRMAQVLDPYLVNADSPHILLALFVLHRMDMLSIAKLDSEAFLVICCWPVSAPTSLPHKISTLVYAFNEKDELLLLHRLRAPNQGLWSPFGGKLHVGEGESPHQCAARETWEEIGLQVKPQDFHLTGLVAERAYEGETHWLMFVFELRSRLKTLPSPHEEGIFEFVPFNQVSQRPIPETDRDVLWPLFQKHRGNFFAVSIRCSKDGTLGWEVDQG